MTRAFEDLTVIELCGNQIGATVGQFFADYGARVVMVEPPGGTPLRAQGAFPMWGRGKQSVVLDAKEAKGRAAIVDLVRDADVLIETFRPGVAARIGLGYPALSARQSGAGLPVGQRLWRTGPLLCGKSVRGDCPGQGRGAEDVRRDEGPSRSGVCGAPYCSATVAQVAVHGALAAFIERLRSGQGPARPDQHGPRHGCARHVERHGRPHGQEVPRSVPIAPPVDDEGVPVHGILFRLMTSVSADGRWLQFSQTAQRLFESFMHEMGLDWMFSDPGWKTAPEFEDPGSGRSSGNG